MSQQEKVFAKGLIFKRNEKAPDWVIGNLSIKADEFSQFLDWNKSNGWLNLSIKKAGSGKFYVELDTYTKDNNSAPTNSVSKDDDLGF